MRPAREAPIADRGFERDRLPVENELPVRGAQRRHHFLATAAGTLVNRRRVVNRHVNLPFVDHVGHEFNEFVREHLRRFRLNGYQRFPGWVPEA